MALDTFAYIPRDDRGRLLFKLHDGEVMAVHLLDIIEVIDYLPSNTDNKILLVASNNITLPLDNAWWRTVVDASLASNTGVEI